MSDEERSESDSDVEDLRTTGLIATRAKRSTAGNLYATLRQNLDDEELQKELLAEDEEDAGDYEGSDKDGDDDEAMESSSDEEDGGPPKEGDAEDLEGEKELKKAERAEARKKRKIEQAKMRIPGWQKKKRVKLADDVKTEDGTPERPERKIKRSNRLLNGLDGPIRQSERASAVASREITHAHLKQSAARSEKQRNVMKHAAERERANKRADLTQEERLAKAAKIEKETSREFGRWEREEAERQRLREEQLAAKRKRGIDGPVIRQWSGSVLWEGEKVKVKRLHGSKNVDEITIESENAEAKEVAEREQMSQHEPSSMPEKPRALDSTRIPAPPNIEGGTELPAAPLDKQSQTAVMPLLSTGGPADDPSNLSAEPPKISMSEPPVQPTLLDGIYEYAGQLADDGNAQLEPAPEAVQTPPRPFLYMPSAPAIHAPKLTWTQTPPALCASTSQEQQVASQQPPSQPPPPIPPQAPPLGLPIPPPSAPPIHIYPGWPPGYQQLSFQQPQAAPPPAPAIPLVREQARRSLVMLEQFSKLDAPIPPKRGSGRSAKESALEPNPLASTLFPASYPSFTPEETRYLTAKMRKRGPEHLLPAAPVKTRCAVTSWPAKFRDPKTGLPYAELQTYKMIQRLLAGGCAWSGFLGAWVGPTYGAMGRPAKGVPEGFAAPPAPKPAPVETTTQKSEEVT